MNALPKLSLLRNPLPTNATNHGIEPYEGSPQQRDIIAQSHVCVGGTGALGLGTAAMLARLGGPGRSVVCFERRGHPGGLLRQAPLRLADGRVVEVPIGFHYGGREFQESSAAKTMLALESCAKTQWDPRPINNRVFVAQGDGKVVDHNFPVGKQAWLDYLKKSFSLPSDCKAIDRLGADTELLAYLVRILIPMEGLPVPHLALPLEMAYNQLAGLTIRDYFQSIGASTPLQEAVTGVMGLYGMADDKASFLGLAIILDHYAEGGYALSNGPEDMVDNLCQTVLENGGRIFTGAKMGELCGTTSQSSLGVAGERLGPEGRAEILMGARIINATRDLAGILPESQRRKAGPAPATTEPYITFTIVLRGSPTENGFPRTMNFFVPSRDSARALTADIDPHSTFPAVSSVMVTPVNWGEKDSDVTILQVMANVPDWPAVSYKGITSERYADLFFAFLQKHYARVTDGKQVLSADMVLGTHLWKSKEGMYVALTPENQQHAHRHVLPTGDPRILSAEVNCHGLGGAAGLGAARMAMTLYPLSFIKAFLKEMGLRNFLGKTVAFCRVACKALWHRLRG